MTDLEQAVEHLMVLIGAQPNWTPSEWKDVYTVTDAARRFANLTSPETIEKVADLLESDFGDQLAMPETRQRYLAAAEAVLRSVEEGET